MAGAAAVAIATLVALSRVIVGAHYPGDVLAGAALGTLVALLAFLPPARRATDQIADTGGARYDRLLGRAARQPQLELRAAS